MRFIALQNDDKDLGLEIFVAEESGGHFKGVFDVSKVVAADQIVPEEGSAMELEGIQGRAARIHVGLSG